MLGKHLFEYAVIRFVPKVEREEFLNIGVILFCNEFKFLGVKFQLDKEKIISFAGETDLLEIEENLLSFNRICNGDHDSAPIGLLPVAERFRWLTATRSTIVQISKVHSGFCDDPNETLERIFSEMVL